MALGLLFSSNNNLLYSQSNDTLTFLEKQLANNYSNIQKADEFTRYKLAENFYSEMVFKYVKVQIAYVINIKNITL